MTETSIYKFFNSTNQGSQEDLILCTEFLAYRIRILIFRNNNDPLLGEVATSELWRNVKEAFPESEEEFYKETRKVLSGKGENYKFSLEDNKFKWEKDLWTRGCIEVVRESEIAVLSDFMINVLTNVIDMQGNISSIEQENQKIKRNLESLHCQLEEMIKIKNEMETVLLKKFILVLNEKKKKIRELQAEIKDLKKQIEPSVYDLSTDEEMSDGEVGNNKEKMKPKIIDLDDKKSSPSHLKNYSLSPKPSTSKENHLIVKERSLSSTLRKSLVLEDDELDDKISSPSYLKNDFLCPIPSTSKQNLPALQKSSVLEDVELNDKKFSPSNLKPDFSCPKPSASKQNHENKKEKGLSTQKSLGDDEMEEIINEVVCNKRKAENSKEKICPKSSKIRKYGSLEESDEDIELKLDTIDNSKITQLNLTEEEPEADLFSQSF